MIQTFIAVTLFVQIAYTTSDPISPDRLGLATPDGRYMLELGEGCEGFGPDQNVVLTVHDDGSATLNDTCSVVIGQQMSDVPCFQTAGVCDVDGED